MATLHKGDWVIVKQRLEGPFPRVHRWRGVVVGPSLFGRQLVEVRPFGREFPVHDVFTHQCTPLD